MCRNFLVCVVVTSTLAAMTSSAFGQKIYWTRGCGNNQILRSNLDGSCVEVVVEDAPCATGLALDISAQKMYWSENGHHRIRRANLDGSENEIIIEGADDSGCPAAITLDLFHGKIYWTRDCPGRNQIRRANLDGSCVETVVTSDDGGFNAQAIAIDLTPIPCPIDFDCDGSVGVSDLLNLLSAWGGCASLPTDIDDDGEVNINDLLELLANWGPCP